MQAAELVRHGIEVHVVVPANEGKVMRLWMTSGVIIHEIDLNLTISRPWMNFSNMKSLRKMVDIVKPDIIHSHFFITTILMRLALEDRYAIPRIFQVPGPLHLEHYIFKKMDLITSCKQDYWIASSKYIAEMYYNHIETRGKVFLSYYGIRIDDFIHHPESTNSVRNVFSISKSKKIIGNICYMYAPKMYLGQFRGIKRHDVIIDAFSKVFPKHDDWIGLLAGNQWGISGKDSGNYEKKLRKMAERKLPGRIQMPGYVQPSLVKKLWREFDLVVHVPVSENCGGVIEPMLVGVPVIASRVGGLLEVVFDGVTGSVIDCDDSDELAEKIENIFNNYDCAKQMGINGKKLINQMFDIRRTSLEIISIYKSILGQNDANYAPFDSEEFLKSL